MQIYMRDNPQQVISRNSSLREAEPRDQEESSSSQITNVVGAQSLSRDDAEKPSLRPAHLTAVLETMSPNRSRERSRSSGRSTPRTPPRPDRGQVFSDAELRIIATGKEVAEQKARLLELEAQLQTQQQTQQIAWEKLQQRISTEETNLEANRTRVKVE